MSTSIPDGSPIGPVEAYWRFRSWTVPITILIGLLAGIAVFATSGTSTATTTLFLTDPRGTPVFRDGSSTPTDLTRFAQQRAQFADSEAVRVEVVRSIDAERAEAGSSGGVPAAETTDSVDDAVSTGTTKSSDVKVSCTAADEARALRICEGVVDAYVSLSTADTQARADAAVDALLAERERLVAAAGPNSSTATIDEIDLNIAQIRSEAALYGSGVEFVEPAKVQEDSRLLPALQYTIAGMLFGAFAMAAIAWFRAGRRPLIATSSDATAALSAPLLGEITARPNGVFDSVAPPGAAYQLLATSLGAVQPEGGVVLTATARPSNDASETVARLATAAAREGRRVLVIDGNLRDRRLSRLFGFEQAAGGLTEVLAGLTSFDQVTRSVSVGGAATLDLLVGGRSVDDPAGLFRSQAARTTINSIRDQYDLVLVDVPALLNVADGSALASEADGVVLIVERGMASNDLDTVRQRLEVLRAHLIGVVYDHRPREQA